MGRGQSKILDTFSSVFGDSRGLRADQAALATAPPAQGKEGGLHFPFAPQDGFVARRRMTLVKRLLEMEEQGEHSSYSVHACSKTDAYKYSPPTPPEKDCQEDLDSLVAQGICCKVDNRVPTYKPTPYPDWPKDHLQVFSAWREAGATHFAA